MLSSSKIMITTLVLGFGMLWALQSGPVYAGNKDQPKLLKGVYANTSFRSCLTTSDYFGTYFDEDLNVQPPGSEGIPDWQSRSTTITYNGDGTGSEVGTAVNINAVGASQLAINCELTYVVNSDQSFEVTRQCNNIATVGVQDVPYTTGSVENGHMLSGGEVLTTATNEPMVQTFNFPVGQTQAVCARSGTQIFIK